jgi:hypothetical protein
MRYRARKKAARRPIWIGRRRTGSAAPGPGRLQIWAGLASVHRSARVPCFFQQIDFSLFTNHCKIQKWVENILCIQKL